MRNSLTCKFVSQDAFNGKAQAGIYRIRHTRRDNKTLVEELLESSCFYFGTIIQEVENVRCYDFDAEGEMSYEEGKEITQGQERGSAPVIDRCTLRYLDCLSKTGDLQKRRCFYNGDFPRLSLTIMSILVKFPWMIISYPIFALPCINTVCVSDTVQDRRDFRAVW